MRGAAKNGAGAASSAREPSVRAGVAVGAATARDYGRCAPAPEGATIASSEGVDAIAACL